MKPVLIYCYDSYCAWCYGFSKVIQQIASEFIEIVDIDVLSGGMVITEKPVHLSATAGFMLETFKKVEDLTGAKFGSDYLWHINHPDDTDWHPHSEKPAIALCIFKEFYPSRCVEFAADLQYALFFEGRDLTDDEAYRHLLEKYSIRSEVFYERLKSEHYKEEAHYEFALVKQLQVSGFPAVFLQTGPLKFHLLASGYTDYSTLKERLQHVLAETLVK